VAEIKTEITINGLPENIWSKLMDFESYPDWNPFIKEILLLDKPIKIGSKLKAKIDGFVVKPIVTEYEEQRVFRWLGRTFLPKIFDGEHQFKIEKLNENQVKFLHEETFKGILVWPILKIIGKKTKLGFENMNLALKERVESTL